MNKQIEEIAEILDKTHCGATECEECKFKDSQMPCFRMYEAEALYTAGYRRQSEGKWVVFSKRGLNSKRNRRINYETYTCAVCGRSNGKHKANFCPNCGAKMKGDDGK